MRGTRTRLITIVAVVSAMLALAAAGAGAQERGQGDARGDVGEPIEAAVEAYQRVYPKISEEAAKTAAVQQDERKQLYEQVFADAEKTFGGAWFDPPSGVLHVAVTDRELGDRAQRLGDELGLEVEPHAVERSFAELERQAKALGEGEGTLGKAARGQVGIDVEDNVVEVAVPERALRSLAGEAKAAGVRLVVDPQLDVEADACTSRANCDTTIRAGSMLWRGSQGNDVCSVGFTARNSSNQRYTYTAGHCSNGNGVTWGTGARAIGPMQSSLDWWAYDAAIIRVTNWWFAWDLGGEIYHDWTAGKSLPVKGSAPTLSYIWAGDTVCLAANYTSPNGPNYCGVVGTNSDPAVRGMVRVNGFDACGGDSGGGWYWLTSSGNRIAFGLHSRSSSGCHGSGGGSTSWFSAVPLAKSLWPSLNIETR